MPGMPTLRLTPSPSDLPPTTSPSLYRPFHFVQGIWNENADLVFVEEVNKALHASNYSLYQNMRILCLLISESAFFWVWKNRNCSDQSLPVLPPPHTLKQDQFLDCFLFVLRINERRRERETLLLAIYWIVPWITPVISTITGNGLGSQTKFGNVIQFSHVGSKNSTT